jgi:hypothetical protein
VIAAETLSGEAYLVAASAERMPVPSSLGKLITAGKQDEEEMTREVGHA